MGAFPDVWNITMRSQAPATLTAGRRLPNLWDMMALAVVFAVIVAIVKVTPATFAPIDAPNATVVTLDPANLPEYALRTTLRMFAALAASLVFTFTFAPLAAKSRRAGLVMVPMLDILQSVPILGFLTFTTAFFMSLFPGRVAGLELAAIFAVFTSQAWNMAFSFYQSLTTLPSDLVEATRAFRLSPWQRFWRLEVPFAMPGLVWNMMLSMSGGWFFVVASEAITLGDQSWKLPGIGSYVAQALDARDVTAIWYAIGTMFLVILAYDQLLFRPLVAWSAKFRVELTQGAVAEDPWLLKLLRRTRALQIAGAAISSVLGNIGRMRMSFATSRVQAQASKPSRIGDAMFLAVVALVATWAIWSIVSYIATHDTGLADLGEVVGLGLITMVRVIVLIALASLVWVPVGVWIGLRPGLARSIQVIAQFVAAFPANLFFPVFVVLIVRFHGMPDIWLTPLMILGTQWYILFNVIAGASAFPGDLKEAAVNFRIGGFLWWRRVMLPGIFPYYVTGAITASGGSWNAAIVAEVASWGDTKLRAHGLGAYIARATDEGNFAHVVLGVAVMSLFVLAFNRAVWRPLYAFATRRLTL
jgi:NitT/TauT family transport system permease protein